MRICRFRYEDRVHVGFYDEQSITPISTSLALRYKQATGQSVNLSVTEYVLDFLPHGESCAAARAIHQWALEADDVERLATNEVELLKPIEQPKKLFLLAGNYAKHIEEGGGVAAERAETFPYVFMKPPTTTLTDPGKAVRIPRVSPDHIDWELELAVVIGKGGKHIREADALAHVAGYTVINDISDRKFKPNPNRKPRDKDGFFDWLHGKWHDSFCPCGPCVTSADAVADPQTLAMKLKVNGVVKQDASTAQQIFPVAAVIEFISQFVTLERGDIISTGTPSGVGAASNDFLKPGDRVEAAIENIGTLVSTIEAEA